MPNTRLLPEDKIPILGRFKGLGKIITLPHEKLLAIFF